MAVVPWKRTWGAPGGAEPGLHCRAEAQRAGPARPGPCRFSLALGHRAGAPVAFIFFNEQLCDKGHRLAWGSPAPWSVCLFALWPMRFLKGRLTFKPSLEAGAPTCSPLPPGWSGGSRLPRPLPVRVWTWEEASVSPLGQLSHSSAKREVWRTCHTTTAPEKSFF